jgi:hypothetical protein
VLNLDTPWRPSDLEQRNGEPFVRKPIAKEFADNKDDVIIYAVERRWQLQVQFASQQAAFHQSAEDKHAGQPYHRRGFDGRDSGMNFSEYVAVHSAH